KLGKVLRVKKLEQNVGTGKAKNIGLQECTYDIVCIVDTDDIYVPERFEKQIKFLEKNPDVSIVGGQILEFVEDTQNPTGMRNVPLSNEDLRNYAKKQSPF
ncbi:glycosyltransferase, partial [Acinetobacter baumannii]